MNDLAKQNNGIDHHSEKLAKLEIMESLTVAAALFPHSKLDAKGFELYAALLIDLPVESIRTALHQAVVESEFFPTVAKIREKVLELTAPEFQHPDSATAWGIVRAAIWKYGYHQIPHFDDSLVRRAVEILDWRTLCSSENEIADRAHFERIYSTLADREKSNARTLPQSEALRVESNVKRSNPSPQIPKTASAANIDFIPVSEGQQIIQAVIEKLNAKSPTRGDGSKSSPLRENDMTSIDEIKFFSQRSKISNDKEQ